MNTAQMVCSGTSPRCHVTVSPDSIGGARMHTTDGQITFGGNGYGCISQNQFFFDGGAADSETYPYLPCMEKTPFALVGGEYSL